MITRSEIVPFDFFRFLYSSPNEPENIIKAKFQGTRREKDTEKQFLLAKDEKIYKVQVKVDDVMLYTNNKPAGTTKLIRAIRFFTTKGQSSQSIDHAGGEMFTEQFDGYTLGYVTGRTGSFVDQLQFYWYPMT
jgi:hypothetical protein